MDNHMVNVSTEASSTKRQAYVGYRLAQNGTVSRAGGLSPSGITRFETRRIDTVLTIRKTDIRNEVTLLWLSDQVGAGIKPDAA